MMTNHGSRRLTSRVSSVELSPLEITCLKNVANGARSFEISTQLGLSLGEIEYHLDNAQNKLGARNRLHAVGMAVSQGLIGIEGK